LLGVCPCLMHVLARCAASWSSLAWSARLRAEWLMLFLLCHGNAPMRSSHFCRITNPQAGLTGLRQSDGDARPFGCCYHLAAAEKYGEGCCQDDQLKVVQGSAMARCGS